MVTRKGCPEGPVDAESLKLAGQGWSSILILKSGKSSISCVTLSKTFALSDPQFLYLKEKGNI